MDRDIISIEEGNSTIWLEDIQIVDGDFLLDDYVFSSESEAEYDRIDFEQQVGWD